MEYLKMDWIVINCKLMEIKYASQIINFNEHVQIGENGIIEKSSIMDE